MTIISSHCIRGQEKKNNSYVELEQTVFYEIFPTIIDSLYYDNRLLPPPPPPAPETLREKGYDLKDGYSAAYKKWKKTSEYKTQMDQWTKKKDSLKKDTTSVYLIIQDTINKLKLDDIKYLKEAFDNNSIQIDSSEFLNESEYQINLKKLKINKKNLIFQYASQFPSNSTIWRMKYDFHIAASIGFSRILFDKSKSYGILNVGYVMGRLNGIGVRIIIKINKEGHWVIEKMEHTWIS
ncbi:hypothetical protein E7Z59_07120 [Robertkochia marina]|uniref:Uncharacterized protein n=1 Tax=Robertkochia marina TaxID=1227945 RepID=A0A4V3UY22_9FLAO|nr:hypothetical protein [Robertkochia marina]THD67426.1 hypothetical protein E7Z59_07120 [Robertkochia marina]TRZ40786.1 hypothetical protein D3A96_15345 [Robertkochia marina]